MQDEAEKQQRAADRAADREARIGGLLVLPAGADVAVLASGKPDQHSVHTAPTERRMCLVIDAAETCKRLPLWLSELDSWL